jgi:hypothetical protein
MSDETSPEQTAGHWLLRLTTEEWLAAAENELGAAAAALQRRAYRPAVTHARRAAGMSLNAVLRERPEKGDAWGRSYMEHVVAVSEDQSVPPEVRAAASTLRTLPVGPPQLVPLGAPDLSSLRAARTVVDWARAEGRAPPRRDAEGPPER